MQPSSPTPTRISHTSPYQLPDHLTAATLVLVSKPDTHFYPVFHVQKDPPPDLEGVDTRGNQITPFDQIVIGSEIDSDLRMFFAEPKHCSLIIDSLGKLYILNFSSANPCHLNETTLSVNILHPLEDLDLIHVAGKDFRVEYKPGYPIPREAVPDGNEPDIAFFDTNFAQNEEIEPLENSSEHYLECIHPQNFVDSAKNEETPIRTPSGKEPAPKIPQSLPKRFVTHSSPTKYSTPAPPRRSATPRSASGKKSATKHDATDNSCASMEVNTSQPSLVPRDISIDTSLEPRRRLSELPKKVLSSPVKLKRKSAPATQLRVSPRLLNLSLVTTADSTTHNRLHRTQNSPASSSVRKMHKQSPKPSTTVNKTPHVTGPLPRRSKSPPAVTNRKSVRFGPSLSPEEFCRHLPPSTPVKRGSTPKSATKDVLRRSTPYKPRPSASKSKSTSPSTFSPKLSPKLFTPKIPRIIPTLSPVEETQAAGPTTKLPTREPKLRKGFGKGILTEIAESQTMKVSERISTPTSMHSKLPNTFSDPVVGNDQLKRRTKVSSLASQSKQSLPNTVPRKKSKSPEPSSSAKRKSVSPINNSGALESRLLKHSPRLASSSPPAQDTPLHGQDQLKPKFSIPTAIKFSLSPNTSVPMTPELYKTPDPVSRDKPAEKRKSYPSDTFQSPPVAATKHVTVTSDGSTGKVYSLRNSTSPIQNTPQSVPKRSPAVLKKSPSDTKRTSDVKSPAVSNRSPVVLMKSPADTMKSPADTMKSPADTMKSPADTMRSPADTMKSPAVPKMSPAIENKPSSALKRSPPVNTTKSPAVSTRTPADPKSQSDIKQSPAVPKKSPAVPNNSPTLKQSPAVQTPPTKLSNTPVRRSSARRSAPKAQISHSQISPEFERSVVHEATPTPKQRPATPRSRSSTPSSNLSSHEPATPRSNTSSISPLPVIYSPRRGRSEDSSKVLHLAWVSPTTRLSFLTPQSNKKSPNSVKIDRVTTPRPPSRRSLRNEDAFNPKLFKTPKNRNRTSQPEVNFTPSLFQISESSRVSKRSSSAPHDTPTPKIRRNRRSVSLPEESEPRMKHKALPEDAFCPYLFRTPKTKLINTASIPENNCMPQLFKSPPTPVLSETRGVKRPARQHKIPSKARKPETCKSPVESPLVLRETRSKKREAQVEKPREPNKRVINKEAPSSPAKVVLVASPPRSPSTSPFIIKTTIKVLSFPAIRMTRNRTSKDTKSLKSPVALRKSKVVTFQKTPSPVKKALPVASETKEIESPPSPVKKALPVASETKEIESSPSPPPIRFLRQRKASTKPVPLKASRNPKPVPLRAQEDTESVPSPIQSKTVVQGDKPVVSQTQTKGILKPNPKTQALPASRSKVSVSISPMASKLSSPKRTRNKDGQYKASKVAFASPKIEMRKSSHSRSPIQTEISRYDFRNESTRASRAK